MISPVKMDKRSFRVEAHSWFDPSLWQLWLVGAALAVGIGLIISGFIHAARTEQSRSWPTTMGVITYFQASMPLQTKEGTRYYVNVGYHFSVANREYDRSGFNLDSFNPVDQETCDALRHRYPVGKVVMVHYSPGDVQQTVLEFSTGAGNWVRFFLGGLFSFFGLAGLTFLRLSAKARLT